MRQSSASLPVWKFQIGESRQVHCCSDPPPEVVSEASRRLCELISRRHAAGVCRSDVWLSQSDNWTCPSPIKYIPELYVKSRFHPVCPTDAHISARKTASVTASRARQPSRLNSNGDYVTWFRAKNFSSQCLCNVPLLCCCSYYLWKLVWNKTTATVIPPYWDFSELFFFSVGKTFLHIIEKKLCFTHHGKCKT